MVTFRTKCGGFKLRRDVPMAPAQQGTKRAGDGVYAADFTSKTI